MSKKNKKSEILEDVSEYLDEQFMPEPLTGLVIPLNVAEALISNIGANNWAAVIAICNADIRPAAEKQYPDTFGKR
jgi:hypothetical protein